MSEKIQSRLNTKASANLQEQIDKELSKPDPSPEKAKAILKKEKDRDENTRGND